MSEEPRTTPEHLKPLQVGQFVRASDRLYEVVKQGAISKGGQSIPLGGTLKNTSRNRAQERAIRARLGKKAARKLKKEGK